MRCANYNSVTFSQAWRAIFPLFSHSPRFKAESLIYYVSVRAYCVSVYLLFLKIEFNIFFDLYSEFLAGIDGSG